MSDEAAHSALAETAPLATRRVYDPSTLLPGILDRLAAGEALQQICRDDGMPSAPLVCAWVQRPEWAERYARAREAGWGLVGEQLLEIADDGRNDWMDREVASGRMERVVDREAIERTRLRLDTRKWMLAKMLPKVFGDRIAVDVTGEVSLAFARLTPRGAAPEDE